MEGKKDMSATSTTPWFIRARLKTRQLMLLTAICDEGNIHRAAEVLNMSQPAASKLLKDLEDMLGVSLFERQPRGMRPNWYGETMIRHARIALSSLREAGQEVDALKTGLSGHVSLGAITGPALSLIPQAIMIVARENPKLRVELSVESSNVLIEQLAQGKLDIMIGRLFERQDKTGLRYERLAEEPVCAVVRPGHPLLSAPGLTLAAVEKKPWIVPPAGSVLRHRFDLMFREAGLSPPTQLIETASLLFVTKMLQQRYPNERLRLVHRLDRETSGVLLIARGADAERTFKMLFEGIAPSALAAAPGRRRGRGLVPAIRERLVEKEYLAICWGSPPDGLVDLPLEPDPDNPLRVKMRIAGRGMGLEAQTRLEAVERCPGYSLVRCTLLTGRQHQIRLHLAALGCPVVGDKLYGPDDRLLARAADGCLTEDDLRRLELPRHALHAAARHPGDGGR